MSARLFNSSDQWRLSVFWQLCCSFIVPRLKLEQASASSLAVSSLSLCSHRRHVLFPIPCTLSCLRPLCLQSMCTSPHAVNREHSWTSSATDFRCAFSPSLFVCFLITVDLIKIAFTLLQSVSSAWYSSASFVSLYSPSLCGRSGCSL
jgi:hypothetical protein